MGPPELHPCHSAHQNRQPHRSQQGRQPGTDAARGLLQHGATNPHGFYRDILLKAKGKSTADEESDEIKREKRSIEEIDNMLAKIGESLAEKEQAEINAQILDAI